MMDRLTRVGRAAATALVLSLAGVGTASADGPTVEMQRDWWQWAMSIPASHNPILDKTGNRCGIAQRGDIWFLAGSTGGKVTRSCTIPEGVKLLVPIVNNFCFPDPGYPDAQCMADTLAFINGYDPANIVLTLDGQPHPFEKLEDVAVPASGSIFSVAVDNNGVFGVKPGIYRANAASGFWGLIGPLSARPEPYTLTLSATGAFSLAVTYKLNVVHPPN